MSDLNATFIDYQETTMDPGWSFVFGALTTFLLLNACLPCLVSLGSRYERRRNEQSPKKGSHDDTTDANSDEYGKSSEGSSQARDPVLIVGINQILSSKTTEDGMGGTEKKSDKKSTTSANDKQDGPTYTPGSQEQNDQSLTNTASPRTTKSEPKNNNANEENMQKEGNSKYLDPVFSSKKAEGISMYGLAREIFCGIADSILIPPYPQEPPETDCRMVRNPSSCGSTNSQITSTPSESSSARPRRRTRASRAIISEGFSVPNSQSNNDGNPRKAGTSSETVATSKGASSPEQKPGDQSVAGSVMSQLNHDDVSFNDAVDSYVSGGYKLPMEDGTGEVDLLCGKNAWWKPSVIAGGFDRVVGIAEFDDELSAIISMAIPLSFQSFITGVFTIVDVALIGHLFGTNEANSFVIISLLVAITNTFNYGSYEALGSLLPSALGAEDETLAGKYINTSLALYSIGCAPTIFLWGIFSKDAVSWFGFNEESAQLAQEYAYFHVLLEWVAGLDYCLHLFLDVTDHKGYSVCVTWVYNLTQTAAVVLPWYLGQNSLVAIGIWRLAFGTLIFSANVIAVVFMRWLQPFYEGLLIVPLSEWKLVKKVLKKSVLLGISYFLTYSEWDLVVFFASALGPAEVATWCLLGYVWAALEYISDGVADAAEVRCAYHLGCNDPEKARLSAYKSLYTGLIVALIVTSVLFLVGEDLATWLTPDPTLQRLMIELIPLVGIGQVVKSTGIMCWALVGSQGRYMLATSVQIILTWGLTIPLAAVVTYYLNIDLQGLLAALILGFALSGVGNRYILMRSQWDRLARIVSAETQVTRSVIGANSSITAIQE